MDELMSFEDVLARYDPVIGLEVHVELSTKSKMWCGCSTEPGAAPNTQVCPVCLGLPGSLPVVNAKAVEAAVRIGLMLGCHIAPWCRFARKNYFYPDMPKDYQVSQYDEPIAFDGAVTLDIDGHSFTVPVERAHMEEDAGKLTHVGGSGRILDADYSLVDYNRAGVPLVEIVTKPVRGAGAAAPDVARAYMEFLRDTVRALGVSDARLERGNLRCDVNVSLMDKGTDQLGVRSETKNVNSLRAVADAVRYEMRRQGAVLAAGGRVKQETRHWNEAGFTTPGRSKEQAEDYRYFPEPDLVPLVPDPTWVESLRVGLPENLVARRARLKALWAFSPREFADVLAVDTALDLIDATVLAGAPPQGARKWWMGELARRANEQGIGLDDLPITPQSVAQVQAMVDDGKLTDRLARQVIEAVLNGEGSPQQVVAARGLAVVSDDAALAEAVTGVIAANPDVVAKINDGKTAAIGALIGQVMGRLGGRADAATVRQLIVEALS